MQKALQRIILSLALFISAQLFASSQEIEPFLKKLSFEERIFLRCFFRSIFKYDDFGHVVLGNTKPACLIAIDKTCFPKSYQQKIILKGWECWKKYEALFPHPNFVFLEEEFAIGNETVFHIFVINKKSLARLLQNNLPIFKNLLGNDFSIQSFLECIENKCPLRPLLKYDEALLGMVLGFGIESPLAFKEKSLALINGEVPEQMGDYTGVEAHIPHKCKIFPVAFAGNPQSEEVIQLLEQYSLELEEIWNKYRSSRDPLRLALESLTEVPKERK